MKYEYFWYGNTGKEHDLHTKLADQRVETIITVRLNAEEAKVLNALWHLDGENEKESITRSAYLRQLIQEEAKRRKKDLKASGYELGISGQMSIIDYLE